MTDRSTSHRYLGIDVGTKRYGLALSDTGGTIASPHETVEVAEMAEAVSRVVEVLDDHDIEVVVVGWPVRMDGSEGRAVEHVKTFIRRLTEALEAEAVPEIVRWDERLTSSAAEDVLLEADMSRQRRRDVIDKVAASRILQSYLDSES